MIPHAPRSITQEKEKQNMVILSSQNLISDPQSEKNKGKQVEGYDTKASGCFCPLSPPSLLHQPSSSSPVRRAASSPRLEDDGSEMRERHAVFNFISYISRMSMTPVIVPTGSMYTSIILIGDTGFPFLLIS